MKVLFVTMIPLEANTSVTISNIGLLNGLLSLGCEVDVISPKLDSNVNYYDDSFSKLNINRICLNENSSRINNVINSSKKCKLKDKFISFLKKIYFKFKITDKGTSYLKYVSTLNIYNNYYDYMISTSDPKSSHLFAKKLKKCGLKCGEWIQHWGDPLAIDISSRLIYPKVILKFFEKRVLDGCDKIIYVSPFTLNEQQKNFKKISSKMSFVPLPNVNEYQNNMNVIANQKLNVVYLGDYSSKIRDILPLYNVCNRLNFINLQIAGNTDLTLKNTDNVKVLSRQPHNIICEMENKANVIVSIGNKVGTQIPGKIYYSASSQKEILVTVDGPYKNKMIDYLNEFNRYEVCFNTEKDIEEKLIYIYNKLLHSEVNYTLPTQLLPINVVKNILDIKGE